MDKIHTFGLNPYKFVLMKLSNTINTATESVIQHSLTNSQCATQKLEKVFASTNLSGYVFSSKIRIGYYNFDFYNEELQLAIEIDSYINDTTGIPNKDQPKKLFISSLQIHVLRFTDYQILTDYDEIVRIVRQHINERQFLKAN